MTDEASETISLADEVTKRVLEALRPEFEQIRGEIRAKTSSLGQDIDAIAARMTADKASIDDQFDSLRRDQDNIRQDISRFSTATKATLDGHTSRFRAITERFDAIDGRLDRLEREPIR